MALKELLRGMNNAVKGVVKAVVLKKAVLSSALCLTVCFSVVTLIVAVSWNKSSPGELDAAGETDTVGYVKNVVDPTKPESATATPASDAKEVNPVSKVTVKVVNGEVRDVKLFDAADGISVSGKYSPDADSWVSTRHLDFSRTYYLEYSTVGSARKLKKYRQEFSTVSPAYEANAWVTPGDGVTVGIGQPIQINFSEPVANRQLVQKVIDINSSKGQKPIMHWYSDTMLRIRPKEFWAADSKITVKINLLGVELGNGMIGNDNVVNVINVSSERRAVVDNKTKTMSVIFGDRVVKTMPVTLGADHMPSTSGWHVLSDKSRSTKFDPRSIGLKPGDKDWYQPFYAQWTFRISSSGEFIHQALPTAFSSVGTANVSHGCVGMLPADAQWFWENMQNGDPVQIVNTTGGLLQPLDGFGDWNMPWEQWVRQ